jgi:capsular exopolysaccharide synthesis family protein
VPSRTRAFADRNGERRAFWGSQLSESVDGIRTTLLHDASVEALQVVMVTSAVGSEGKTTLASHLATSLARAGRRTVFVDCDLRRPTAHLLFDVPNEPGFSELLRGETTVEEVVRATNLAGLWMIPAGQVDSQALRELASGAPGKAFSRLKEQFEFIIVDSSPLLPVTDALTIGQHADGVILALLHNFSQLRCVFAACDRLAQVRIRVLGAVVNAVRGSGYGPAYYDRYGYSYGYGHARAVTKQSAQAEKDEDQA